MALCVPQTSDYVLVFHSGGDKLHAGHLHFCQQPLTLFVDEDDFFEIHDSMSAGRPLAMLTPASAHFLYPWAGQPAANRPALPAGTVGITNPKHLPVYLFVLQKRMRAAKSGTLI